MSRYVDPTEQLVTAIVVGDIRRSVDFYRRLGFELLHDGGDFVELTWEDHRLFLAELSAFRDARGAALTAPPAFPLANVRVMVPDVDECWKRANALGAWIITPVGDRYYGLRDFIISDPDRFVALPVFGTREGDIKIAPPLSIVDPDATVRSRFIGQAAFAAVRAATGV
jgi:catechol 2,3-dioxygenase-like lactoylglutathione lyase family enzyme